MKLTASVIASFLMCSMLLVGCTSSPPSDEARDTLIEESQITLKEMQTKDPGLGRFLENAYGYVIFPNIGKGALIAGGAYGRGVVHEQGRHIGYSQLSQATVGLQAGGQTYSELIVFQNQEAMNRFKSDQYAFAASVSAVALKSGVAEAARYSNGVAVFVDPKGGAMIEASIGGQKFEFSDLDETR